ncbi:hypothetical protein B1T45_23680 [Mycobacterium kansasii]|uniref:PE family protein n=3 Tax=Mycobacterium kansasii TaxID=1768 RepID=A0A1V3XPM8_MYCKA|nr:hypothetical protein [Mycobacterium kansasii]AGZ54049.1 hypothetical protein MKAN_05915 [Mycobacterium kansasii ATCC 12478]EUA01589.1 hypothetical protein I547_4101 [Mycobacterium kansasii 824]EUA20346.1 hypothetical protein I545_2238 [Mycobacterium kansasii 662]ARG63765.1 hypothetical protein B1T45_23680 [Mycobacterium kansasii]ARG71410.1 hypothetical protein B1T47_23025 [Mycobacterium kansasii]
MVVFAVEPAVVGASAVSQAGLAAQHGAGVAGCAAALVGVVPMGEVADSAAFAGVGAAYVSAAGEHARREGRFLMRSRGRPG